MKMRKVVLLRLLLSPARKVKKKWKGTFFLDWDLEMSLRPNFKNQMSAKKKVVWTQTLLGLF